MPKTLTVRIDDATYRLIAEAAEAENRSVSNFIETAAREKAVADIFVQDEEMAEIRSDPNLRRRLKSGHKDAASRRGGFVCIASLRDANVSPRSGSSLRRSGAPHPGRARRPGLSDPSRDLPHDSVGCQDAGDV